MFIDLLKDECEQWDTFQVILPTLLFCPFQPLWVCRLSAVNFPLLNNSLIMKLLLSLEANTMLMDLKFGSVCLLQSWVPTPPACGPTVDWLFSFFRKTQRTLSNDSHTKAETPRNLFRSPGTVWEKEKIWLILLSGHWKRFCGEVDGEKQSKLCWVKLMEVSNRCRQATNPTVACREQVKPNLRFWRLEKSKINRSYNNPAASDQWDRGWFPPHVHHRKAVVYLCRWFYFSKRNVSWNALSLLCIVFHVVLLNRLDHRECSRWEIRSSRLWNENWYVNRTRTFGSRALMHGQTSTLTCVQTH